VFFVIINIYIVLKEMKEKQKQADKEWADVLKRKETTRTITIANQHKVHELWESPVS